MIDIEKYRNLLGNITPKYISKVFEVDNCPLPLTGESIKHFLGNCTSLLVYASTLGEEFDRLLRKTQITDMAGAVVLDSMAGEYLESFCQKQVGGFGFSPGYGDLPLSVTRDIIEVLRASTKIGLCVTDSLVMTPQKSITGIKAL
jgi:hypothetical protein